jgi:hypothetical protein
MSYFFLPNCPGNVNLVGTVSTSSEASIARLNLSTDTSSRITSSCPEIEIKSASVEQC